MDMSSGSLSNYTLMTMGPFTTEVGTSILWFDNWIPTTAPATFGACIGLFFLGAFSRFLEAFRIACSPPTPRDRDFRFGTECVCAVLFMFASGVNYFLMLAVMQFNVWLFIAILFGLGVGELGFGRYCRTAGASLLRRGLEEASMEAREDGFQGGAYSGAAEQKAE
ncbi:hypothetical protein JCM24511_10225 [Saitozyma sp. JCM 24511]|nr:hypothetical protein JCM24511_10225 [Saitozyma sp. JCM 24511]